MTKVQPQLVWILVSPPPFIPKPYFNFVYKDLPKYTTCMCIVHVQPCVSIVYCDNIQVNRSNCLCKVGCGCMQNCNFLNFVFHLSQHKYRKLFIFCCLPAIILPLIMGSVHTNINGLLSPCWDICHTKFGIFTFVLMHHLGSCTHQTQLATKKHYHSKPWKH